LLGGGVDFVGGVFSGGGDAWSVGGEVEPAAFELDVADELGVGFAAGAHESGADGGDADSFVAEFGVEAFGEADEGELGGGVRQHVWDSQLAAYGGDIDDAGATGAGDRLLGAEVWERGPGGVEGGEEVDLHGALEGCGGLGFDGADLDDASVVDEDVDATETGDGFGDEALALGGLSEVGGDEVEVFRGEVWVVVDEGGLGLLELGAGAGGEDELYGLLGEAGGDGEAEAARASGDEDYGVVRDCGGAQGAEGGDGSGCEAGCGGGEVERIEGAAHRFIGCGLHSKGKNKASSPSRMIERKLKAVAGAK